MVHVIVSLGPFELVVQGIHQLAKTEMIGYLLISNKFSLLEPRGSPFKTWQESVHTTE